MERQDAIMNIARTTEGNIKDIKITDLIPLDRLQQIQDAFAQATGVASIITDTQGTPITRPSNFCRLCQIIRQTPKGMANCQCSDAALGKKNPKGPLMQPCLSGGLWDGGANICVGNVHIANWLIGQVRNSELNEDKMLAYAHEIDADEKIFRAALSEVTVMPTERFAQICQTLFLVANQISDQAYQNLALRQSENNLQTTLDSIGDAVIATDAAEKIVRMNPVAETLTGWSWEDSAGQMLAKVFPLFSEEDGQPIMDPVAGVLQSDKIAELPPHTLLRRRDGSIINIADSAAPIRNADGTITGVVLVFRDVTEQRKLEEQVRHSQKMDAIGQLAGGVAHDFNNMLAGIMGAADLLTRRLQNDANNLKLVNMIVDATEKATSLTKKLLDFSRKGRIETVPIEIHTAIQNTLAILERSIDRKVKIELEFKAVHAMVLGDSAQLQNAILNLGINARDAMPEGGVLKIATANIVLEERDSRIFADGIKPGEFIEIAVSDTGIGISPENRKHLFEPFFTTKAMGKGTGLGLAGVYAMIKDHHGAIHVYSEVAHGTVFKIYLPIISGTDAVAENKERPADNLRPGGRVLLVDDEAIIRNIGTMILEEMGCDVTVAEDGAKAVQIVKNVNGHFDLIILDLIMPNMDGREAFHAIREIVPEIPVIFSSGFTNNQKLDDLLLRPGVMGFVQKPYRVTVLREMVARALSAQNW